MMSRSVLFLLFFSFVQNSFSQQFYIRGRVTDIETQLPLKGASVYINNTTKGSTTNDNGDFELGPLQPGRYVVKLALTATAGPRSFARTLGVRLR